MPGWTSQLAAALVYWVDRIIPKRDALIIRTSPDFDDQARELIAALDRVGADVTLLVGPGADPGPVGAVAARVRSVRSLAGLWAYWRARLVIHTHGIFGSIPSAPAKRFLNVWHGMPIKRLPVSPEVGRQSDRTIATADIHARHLAETWALDLDQVVITGLPRNDVLHPSRHGERPATLRQLAGDRPIVVWLPTFRAAAAEQAVDGVEMGIATQFAEADPDRVAAMMGRLGAFGIVKPHPLAPIPETEAFSALAVWTERDLTDAGLTLYHLLAQADVLVSDHSSVWVDFLLTGRPMVFAVSDLEEYRRSRGFYFEDIEALLPGPMVTDLDSLEQALASALTGQEDWTDRRALALVQHHVHRDGASAGRVAELAVAMVRKGWS
jgi:CDP-glycerol glycerophosphotransferase (TagB/SpsB family)